MGTHWMIFLTIGNLVFPPSFSFAGQVKGQTDPPPPNKRSVRCRVLKPAVKPCGLLSRSRHLRDKMFTHRRCVN